MAFSKFNTKALKRGTVYLLALCILTPSIAGAYQIRDGSSFRVMATKPDSSSASFKVNDKVRIEPSKVVVSQTITIPGSGGGTQTSVSDNSEKYDASDWLLTRKYDELVKLSEAEEKFLTSAPEAPKKNLEFEDPETLEDESDIPASNLQTSVIDTEVIDESLLVSFPKPEQVNQVTLEPKNQATIRTPQLMTGGSTPSPESPALVITKDDFLNYESEGYFKMSAPMRETEALLDESEPDLETYCATYVRSQFQYDEFWKVLAHKLMFFVCGLLIIFYLLVVLIVLMIINDRKRKKQKTSFWKRLLSVFTVLGIVFSGNILPAEAVTTSPQMLIYEGELLNDLGQPLAGDYTFRFSFWDSVDHEDSDEILGAINGAAPNYKGWTEVQTQNLGGGGSFSFRLGKVNPFPDGLFDDDTMFLQVDVKLATHADSFYEMIDIDTSDPAEDRKVISSVPYAFNANKLDYRDVGLNPGDIPYIDDTSGKLDASIIPGVSTLGTDNNTFTLDQDGDAAPSDNLILEFGSSLGKSLLWNNILDRFEFNDDLFVSGNLVVTGDIVAANIASGDYELILSPRYPKSALEGDGTDNHGSMYEEVETVLGLNKQILRWDTKQSDMQDYDILVRYQLPENFKEFKPSNNMVLEYRTSGTSSDAKIDVTLEKEGLAGDFLSSSGIGLTSNTWNSRDFTIASGASWVAGDIIWIKIKMQAKTGFETAVADIKFNMVLN